MTFRTVVAIAVLTLSDYAYAQTPTGTVAGAVKDATGAVIQGAAVSVANVDTRQARDMTTSDHGLFTVAALAPGPYRITIEAPGFKRIERETTVEAGTTAIVEVILTLGDVTETLNVPGASLSLRRDHHQVGGLVTRDQIDRLPINGRNILELADVEPGVIPTRLGDGRIFVSALGGGLQAIPRIGATRITVDGASITTPGTAGALLQISPDAVQEFQMATVNFDATTSLTSNGAINIVTRSGTNQHHGNGFYLYRDHRLAAYPGLRRDPNNPDPAFERHQFGFSSGGPVRRGRVFFFASVERTDQTGAILVRPLDEFDSLGGLFRNPYIGTQVNARADAQLHRSHAVFARFTSDRNATFVIPTGGLPSSWSQRVNDTKQLLFGMTNVISENAVNELRASQFRFSTPMTLAPAQECAGCFGLGEIRTVVSGADLIFGGQGAGSTASGWRFQLTDTATWQIGSHTLRAGMDWEHNQTTIFNFGQPDAITLFSPRDAREPDLSLPLPAQFVTPTDILSLPLKDFSVTVGSGTVLWEGFRPERVLDLYRLHVADTWRAAGRLTLNAGLGWSYEPNAVSQDLAKPSLLVPILGVEGLKPPKPQSGNFSTTVGFVWAATADGRTLVRGGIGRYFDPAGSTNNVNRIRERELLSPLGTGRLMDTGRFLVPTSLTGAQQVAMLPSIRATLLQSLAPDNRDLSVRNIDLVKLGQSLLDPAYGTPSAIHLSLGVQREVSGGLVLSADLAWKRFSNTFINGIDYNRFDSVDGPIIPRCPAPLRADVRAVCSNGPLFFDTTTGRARYRGLLLRAEKRFTGRGQLLASYALASFVGSNGTGTGTSENAGGRFFGFNNDDWGENYGPLPTDQRHVLNVSGAIELPMRFSLAASVSAYSAPPFAPYIRNVDFNGDGTINDLLPGTTVNQFGGDLGKDDLIRLVDQYNQHVAGTRTPTGQTPPLVQLPSNFSFNDTFFTQDLRLTRSFQIGVARRQVDLFVDVFNLLNTSNLVGFGSDLTASSFGQPGDRVGQVFGSGGSRAVQIGARFQF